MDTAMATYSITPKFDYDQGKFVFLNNKGKSVTFNYIPLQFDMRGGLDSREYNYLQEPMLSPDPGYLEIIVPPIVLPKSYLTVDRPTLNGWQGDSSYDGYVLIQGNTRFKLIEAVIDNIEAYWQTLQGSQDEKIAIFEQGFSDSVALTQTDSVDKDVYIRTAYSLIRGIKPFSISVLPESQVSYDLILWLQRAVNDAVKTQGVLNNARFAVAYYDYLFVKNEQEGTKISKKDLIAQAMQSFGLQSSRFYHFTKILSSPEWLQAAISDDVLTLDTAIDFLNGYGRAQKEYEKRGKTLTAQLSHFWDMVKVVAEQDRNPDKALKIFSSHVKKAVDDLIDAVIPSDPFPVEAEGTEGDTASTVKDTASAEENTSKMTTEQYAQAVHDLLSDEKIMALYDALQALAVGDASAVVLSADGEVLSRYTEASIKKIHKALTQMNNVLSTVDGNFTELVTVEQERLSKELKAAQKAAEKAAKAQQSSEVATELVTSV